MKGERILFNYIGDPIYNTDPFLIEEDNDVIPDGVIKITYRDDIGKTQKVFNTIPIPFGYKNDVTFNSLYIGKDNGELGKYVFKEIKFISDVKKIHSNRWFVTNAYLMHSNKKHKKIDSHPDVRIYIPFGSEIGYCIMPHRNTLIIEVANEPRKLRFNNIYEIDYDLTTTQNLYYRERELQPMNSLYSGLGQPYKNHDKLTVKEGIPFKNRIEHDIDILMILLY
jgi:hypothetical protein